MTSATLFREGPDLDGLLAELDAEHDGRVRVVDVEYGRDGGVMGFFAKRTVGVHYVLTSAAEAAGPDAPESFDDGPLEAMLRAAESAELASEAVLSGRPPEDVPADNVAFARMLLDIAAQKAAERQAAAPAPEPHVPELQVFAPTVFTPPPSPSKSPSPSPAPVPRTSASPSPVPASVPVPVPSSVPAPVPAPAPVAVPLRPRVVDSAPSGREKIDHSREERPLGEDAAPDWRTTRAELLACVRTRPVGAHRADDADPAATAAPTRPAPARPGRPTPVAPAPVAPAPVAPAPVAPAPVAPAPVAAAPVAAARAVAHAPAPVRTPLTLRRQLAEIGVPIAWISDDSDSAYEVIEQLVRSVPAAGRLDLGPGQLLVVAGPATQAQAEAVRLCGQLRLDPAAIRTAGCGPDPIRHRRQAATLELDVRGHRGEPCVVVVATDSSGDTGGLADLAWAADIVAALAPDQLYLVVDATCRVADVRRTVATLGRVTALAVVAAARAASPASLWELGIAVASLDGVDATRGRWAALLIDRLTDLDGD